MKTYRNLYPKIYDFDNLYLAYQNARKGKTKKNYITEFEKNLEQNLLDLQFELQTQTYTPRPIVTFLIRDPKTRKVSKADFRDRVIHHALIGIIGPLFESTFIYDSYANRKGKGTLKALQRFDFFKRKVTKNNTNNCYVLKADVKHYFEEVDHNILQSIIQDKIADKSILWLIQQILSNGTYKTNSEQSKGMPLGNLTSQFFANVYLNELDNFLKRKLQIKYYLRYVDDFVVLHRSKNQLISLKEQIDKFLSMRLKLELHKQKSRIILLMRGVDFVGFRNFAYHKLLRKRNIRKIKQKVHEYELVESNFSETFNSYIGWRGFAQWGNTAKLRNEVKNKIIKVLLTQI
jgi:RNA-directed DNA polymerase